MEIKQKIDTMLKSIMILLFASLVLDGIWQISKHYLVSDPAAFTDELIGFLLIWVGMLGTAYAIGKGHHLAIDLLPNKFNPTYRVFLLLMLNGLIALFAVLAMVIGGTSLVYLTFLLDQRSTTLEIPLGYVYSCVPISGLLIVYYCVSNIKQLPSLKTSRPA